MKQDIKKALEKDEKPYENKDISESLEMSKETSLEYKEGVLNMIWFICEGSTYSIVHKLIEEGNNIICAEIKSKKDIDEEEDPEAEKRRNSLYDGIIDKKDYKEVMKSMKNLKDKDKWIVWFELNDLAPIAEEVLKMGFTKGLFPTIEDLKLEKDREYAKSIVEEHYPDLTLGEVQEFSDVQSGVDFLNETDKVWVLKGNSEQCDTVVPFNEDPEIAKETLIDALEAHKSEYEEKGFILEEKIIGMLEITPQCVWIDGDPIFTDIDFENKPIGAGNISVQTGAMQSLVVKTDFKAKINKMAFPEWIQEQAKKHVGLFIFDASMLVKDGVYYFGEFCANRWGFDSIFAEVAMGGSATDFFTNLFEKKNPLKNDFGVAIRGINLHKDGKERRVLEGVSMSASDPDDTWVYDCKEEDGKYVTAGTTWDLVVFTGVGETVNEASHEAYEAVNGFAFDSMFFRPEFDMLSIDYISSLPNRFSELNHKLFEATDMEDMNEYNRRKQMKQMQDKIEEALKENE